MSVRASMFVYVHLCVMHYWMVVNKRVRDVEQLFVCML